MQYWKQISHKIANLEYHCYYEYFCSKSCKSGPQQLFESGRLATGVGGIDCVEIIVATAERRTFGLFYRSSCMLRSSMQQLLHCEIITTDLLRGVILQTSPDHVDFKQLPGCVGCSQVCNRNGSKHAALHSDGSMLLFST